MTADVVLPRLHPAQQQIKREAARYTVSRCGRRFGKTLLGIDLALAVMLRGRPVGWFAPTYKSLEQVWRKVTSVLAPITVSKDEQEHRLVIAGGGSIEFWSLASPATTRGQGYALAIIDEAAHIPDLKGIWDAIIFPMLLDWTGGALFISTPNGLNWFYELYQRGVDPLQTEWSAFHFTTYDNPHLDPVEIDALRQGMSEIAFRQEILAEFIEDDAQVFTNLDAALRALTTSPEAHAGHVLTGGVDWGKSGDFTALSIGCKTCGCEVELERFNQIDWAFQYGRIVAQHARWNPISWLIELNSIGSPNFEQLQRIGLPVVGFMMTGVSKKPLIEMLALALNLGWLKLLPDPVGKFELQSYQRARTKSGIDSYGAPQGENFHDDTVIARALMWKSMYDAPTKRSEASVFEAQEYMSALAQLVGRL